jgi:hypothetical protein
MVIFVEKEKLALNEANSNFMANNTKLLGMQTSRKI